MDRHKWDKIKRQNPFTQTHWPTFAIISVDVFFIFSAWYLSFISPAFFTLGCVLLALGLFHFYLLLHEATHSAVSHSKALNDIVGHICGWLIIMPFLPRQSSHLLHHTWTGHPVRDPANNRMIQRFSVITPQQVKKLEFVWKYWFPAIIVNDRIGLWRAPFQQRENGLKSRRVQLEILWARLYVVFYIIAVGAIGFSGYAGHFFALYLPSLLIVYMLEELVNLPHHAETPLLSATDKALPYWEQHQVTHSCKEVPIWSRYVLLHFNLHTAHHLYPTAPWYGLARLQNEIHKADPSITSGHETQNEVTWSLHNRKRPLLNIMGHYFDKIPGHGRTYP